MPLLSALALLEFRVLVFGFELDFLRLAAEELIWQKICALMKRRFLFDLGVRAVGVVLFALLLMAIRLSPHHLFLL